MSSVILVLELMWRSHVPNVSQWPQRKAEEVWRVHRELVIRMMGSVHTLSADEAQH